MRIHIVETSERASHNQRLYGTRSVNDDKNFVKFVLKEICRKSILGVTKYLKKVSCRHVTWLQIFQKNCHTEKSAVVLPTIS